VKEYVIPVAFTVNAQTEQEAAARLCKLLTAAKLIEREDRWVDEWWMPNHPQTDGSDREAVLMWVPLISYAGRVTEGETPQQSVDKFMNIIATWHKNQ